LLLISLMIGVFMGALDNSILAPAIAAIGHSFSVSPAAVVLAFSIYSVFYAVAVPVLGKLADRFGYRQIYAFSMALFALGSAGSALSPSLSWLVAARVVQAVGAGGLFPVAQAIIGVTLPPEQRGRALGAVLGVFALGNVLGPNLGGLIVQYASWHWVFWINVPIGAVGVWLLSRVRLARTDRPPARLDLWGAALVALTFASLVLGIQTLQSVAATGFFSWVVGGKFLLAAAGLVALILVELRQADPILDVRLLSSPQLAPLLLVSVFIGYALLGGIVFSPTYAQIAFGSSPFASGALLDTLAVGLGLTSALSGNLIAKVGAKPLALIGAAGTAAGLGVMSYASSSLGGLLLGLTLLGLGLGLVQGPLSYLALGAASRRDQGQVSGLVSLTRSLGGAAGITLSGVFLGQASAKLASLGGPGAAAGVPSGASLASAPAFVRRLVVHTLSGGVLTGWHWAFFAAGLALLLTPLIPGRREEGAQPASRGEA
jgi:EmrB/QacA subfamily drug resistance transporter